MSQPDIPSDAIAQEKAAPSISAAAQAYQIAMQQQAVIPPPGPVAERKDVPMEDVPPPPPVEPIPTPVVPNPVNVPSPLPGRMGTPLRTNGNDHTSRATSQHPDPAPAIPKVASLHGAPTRQYLNSKVTGPLLDGMKLVAKEKPKDPLRMLGEYLLQKSQEIEGT